MTATAHSFLPSVTRWILECEAIKSAVLFGSSARADNTLSRTDQWSDIDLHVVTNDSMQLQRVSWVSALPEFEFCLQSTRAATGGVQKITAIFTAGQIDMVIVPSYFLRLGQFALQCGLNRRVRFLKKALNEMATCLHSGFTFIKGEKAMRTFYDRVAKLPGVRLEDDEISSIADLVLCDLLWILQKLERGEVVAAQHALHLKVVDANLRLWREIRLRRDLPVPSFGLGRRVEILESPLDRKLISVSAAAMPDELKNAAEQCLQALRVMMGELLPGWSVPPRMQRLLSTHLDWPLKPGC